VNQHQIQLVQQSFRQVKPTADTVAGLFYDRLFELDPSLRPLFKQDLSEQKCYLITTLTFVVAGLNKPERILPAVRQLGARHVGYGVQTDHYQTVGQALLWALAQGLGQGWTAEVEEAWATVYRVLSTAMQETAVA
jgi:hemoglobin-like flavoprotein